MTTQPPDLKKLREVAERATPGPWHRNIPPASHYNTIFSGRNTHVLALTHDNKHVEANAEFVTTFNPQTIQALLNAYEASARDAERYRWWRENVAYVLNDEDGLAGMAFSFQIPLTDIQTMSNAGLFDAIADAARHATQGD